MGCSPAATRAVCGASVRSDEQRGAPDGSGALHWALNTLQTAATLHILYPPLRLPGSQGNVGRGESRRPSTLLLADEATLGRVIGVRTEDGSELRITGKCRKRREQTTQPFFIYYISGRGDSGESDRG